MDLSNGKYLGGDVVGFCGDWVVVWDGKYNYMLFDSSQNEVVRRYEHNWLPSNNICSGSKYVEYFSSFDNALDGLCLVCVEPVGFKCGSRLV